MGQIIGKILKPDLRVADYLEVLFRPASGAPGVRPSDAIAVEDVRRMTDSDGVLNLSLASGAYNVWIGNARPKRINVLDLAFPQLLQDLLGGGPGSASVGSNFEVVGNQMHLLSDQGAQVGICARGVFPNLQLGMFPGGTDMNFRHRLGMLELINADDQEFYAPIYRGPKANPYLTWLDKGADPITNQRYNGGRLQLRNMDADCWYSVLLLGSQAQGFLLGNGSPEQ